MRHTKIVATIGPASRDPEVLVRMVEAGNMTTAWAGLANAVHPGEVLYLADGAVRLRVKATRPDENEIDAKVEVGGAVVSRQGLNIPGEAAGLPSVSEADLDH